MSVKLFHLPIIVLLVGAFTVSALAQADCLYPFSFDVRSTDDKVVDNADVRIGIDGNSAEAQRLSRDANGIYRVSLTLACGIRFTEAFHLKISAPDFASREQTITFDKNNRTPVRITLLTTSENAAPKTLLTGTIVDINGALILFTQVTATRRDGKKYTAPVDSEGVYELLLPFGKYRVDAEGEAFGFCRKTFEDYRIPDSYRNKMSLDIVLNSTNSEDCPPKCEPDPKSKYKIMVCM